MTRSASTLELARPAQLTPPYEDMSQTAAWEKALSDYQKIVAAHNRKVLGVVIRAVELRDWSEDGLEEDQVADAQLGAIEEYLGCDLPEDIQIPADVMSHYDELAILANLDGTAHVQVEDADRKILEAKYLNTVQEALRKKATKGFADRVTIPDEFRWLMSKVHGLCGPGTAEDHTREKLILFAWLGYDMRTLARRVMGGDEAKFNSCIDKSWDVQVGWDIGYGYADVGSYLMYCRQGAEKPWGWRWIIRLRYSAIIFDNLASMLAYYAYFEEVDLSTFRHDGCTTY